MKKILSFALSFFFTSVISIAAITSGTVTMTTTGTQTIYICGTMSIQSPGYPANYPNNCNTILIIYPGADGTNSKVSVNIGSYDIEGCCDDLHVFNGAGTGGSELAYLYGTGVGGIFTSSSSDGALTLLFRSDGSVRRPGWTATANSSAATNLIATNAPASTNACIGAASPTLTIVKTGQIVNTPTFQWFNNGGTDLNTGGVAATGTGNNTASYSGASTAIAGTTYYYCRVTDACGNVNVSNTAAVVVLPLPTVTTLTPAGICSGVTTSIPLTASVPSSFTWTLGTNTGPLTTPTECVAGCGTTIAQALTNPSNSINGSIVYNIVATSATGGCVSASTPITQTVYPKPTITTSNPSAICSGANTNIVLAASASSNFIWTAAPSGGVTGTSDCASGCPGTIIQSLVNPSNSIVNSVSYNVTPITTVGTCIGTASILTQNVNPKPSITGSAPDICSGSSTSINLSAAVSTPSSFAWTVTPSGGITGSSDCSSSCGTTISQTLTNPFSTISGSVTYNVIPTSTVGSCIGSAALITQNVKPAPDVTSFSTASLAAPCLGSSTSITITSSTLLSGTAYTVNYTLGGAGGNTGTFNAPMIYGSGTGTFNILAVNLPNPGATTVTINSISATLVGCSRSLSSGNVAAFTVNAPPTPTFALQPGAAMCQNSSTTYTTQSAASYSWSVPGTPGIDYNIISGGITGVNSTVTLSWLTSGIKTVTVNYADGNGCTGTSPASNTTTVNPVPTPFTVGGGGSYCLGGGG